MALMVPPGITSMGMVSVLWVDALASPGAPTLAELTSATAALDIGCYIHGEWTVVDAEEEIIEDRRFCSKTVYGDFGEVKVTFDDLRYVIDPQHPDSITSKASALLTEGKQGFLVLRWGKDNESPLASGDIVDVYPAKIGRPVKQRGDGKSNLVAKQRLIPTGEPSIDVTVAA